MITEKSIYTGNGDYHLVCEPFLREAANGDLIIVFQSGGRKEPANDNVLCITRSKDRGKSWSEPEIIFTTPGKGTWSSEMFVDGEQITLFVYEVEQEHHFATLKAFRSFSTDNGYSWSEREPFGDYHHCCNMRQRIVRSDGAWVIPYCYTTPDVDWTPDPALLPEKMSEVWGTFYKNNVYRSGALISTDRGQSFVHGMVPADREQRFLWEPSIVELSDGKLVMLMRHEYNGWLWRSESSDGGLTWSKAEQSDIPDGSVKMRLFRLTDGTILLFCHPNPHLAGDPLWRNNRGTVRAPLQLWVSRDDMKSWDKKVDLQHLSAPRAGRTVNVYNYPDGHVDEREQKLYIAIDLNRNELVVHEIPFAVFQ